MKRLLFIPLFLVLAVAMILPHFFNRFKLFERNKYENFLQEQYANLPKYSPEEISATPKPGRPDEAAYQNFFMTLDPELGRVPLERLRTAFQETREMQREIMNRTDSRSLNWEGIVSNMGGRTRAAMFDPNNPSGKKVWAGGVTGGLWRNNDITNDNSSWIPVGDFWDNMAVSSITYDPNNSNIFYVGTGEAFTAVTIYRESSGRGVGIWKTIDGGEAWELLSSTENFAYVTNLVVRDEDGASVVYAGVVSGVYYGTHESFPSDGLYRSDDGGETWEQVLPNIFGESIPYAPSDIEIGADGRIFIGTMKNLDGEGGAVILYSDSGLSGSWTIFDNYQNIIESGNNYNIPGRVVLASAPSNENIVYAIIGSGYLNQYGFNYSYGNYILRSTNKGLTWQERNTPEDYSDHSWATLAWHALSITVDPNDPNTIFAGGLDMHKSTNSGNSWTKLSDWALMYYGGGDEYLHGDHHSITFKSGLSDEILFSNDGGVFYTTTGTNFYPVFMEKNKGYSTLQFYTCAIDYDMNRNYFLGGLQDNGTLLYTDSDLDINDLVTGGDGAYCFFDQDEPELIITSVYYNRYYFIDMDSWNYEYDNSNSGVFINPADYDDVGNVLYANAVRFDGGLQNRIIRIDNIPGNPDSDMIYLNTNTSVYFSHVKVSPYSDNSTTLFLGTQSGRLYRINNAQAYPQTTEIGASSFPTGNISCVDVGGSEDTLLVTFSNYGVLSVWQTHNGGNSWQEKEGNLPDMPIRWVTYHPDNSNQAMLATEIGVWTTTNLQDENVTWQPSVNGLANVRVDMLDLRESDHTVLAATHGRGFFSASYDFVPPAQEIDVTYETGWNLVGLPLDVSNPNYISLFPDAIEETLYGYQPNGYVQGDSLFHGNGYWLRFSDENTTTISGSVLDDLQISLAEGWNLISGITTSIAVNNILDPSELIIPGTVYGFDNGYLEAETIEPGYGYWLRSSGEGEITLSASAVASKTKSFQFTAHLNTLKLEHMVLFFGNNIEVENVISYSLPPKPPIGAKDIRFSGDTKLCATDECVIEMVNDEQPITIGCDINDGESWEIIPVIASGTEWSEAILLTGENQFTLNLEIERLILRKTTYSQVPTEFALFPAYPNPFNPITTIRFSVGAMHASSIKVYDITGRLIETLIDEELKSGHHTVQWNATGFSSGVYFVRLESGTYSQSQKLILLK